MKPALFAAATAALATLPACNRSAEAASTAPGVDLPVVSAGKWRWTEAVDGKDGGMPGERCYGERTIWDIMEVGAAGIKSCERTIEKDGSRHVATYHCETRQTTTDITTTVNGDFSTSYRLESVQTFDPPVAGGTARQTIAIRAERLAGADCK